MKRLILSACIIALLSFSTSQGMYLNWIIQYSSCGNPTGYIKALPYGGTAPYTFSWNTGATTDSIGGFVGAGQWYVVTVTDAALQTLIDSAQVFNDANLNLGGVTSYIANSGGSGIGMHPCPGACNGALVVHQEFINGEGPYSIGFDLGSGFMLNDDSGNPIYGGFCDNDYVTLFVQDALGCTGSAPQMIDGADGNSIEIVEVDGACGGAANGEVLIAANGNELFWIYTVAILDDALVQVAGLTGSDLFDTVIVASLAPGNYTARVNWIATNLACFEDHPFTVLDLGTTCGNISGTVYFDHDQDCVQDGIDPGIPYRLLQVNPGPSWAITDASGHYSRNLPNGSYDIAVTGSDLLPICPATPPAPFTITSGSLVTQDFADSSALAMDLEAWLYNSPARPGFNSNCHGTVSNLGGTLTGAVTITITFDPVFSYVSSWPLGASVVGNTVTWNFAELNSFGIQDVWVSLSLPPDPLLIGTPFIQSIDCSASFPEANLANNAYGYNGTITGSYDPNEKTARTNSSTASGIYFIDIDSVITYTIQFQNTGSDTAFTVVITDTLSEWLDISTLHILGASHAFTPDFAGDRVLRFTFDNILLPDSGTNELASHGFVSFRIAPDEGSPLLGGTVIANAADIFFDFNPPVHTNNADLVAEFSVGVDEANNPGLRLSPNPAGDLLIVQADDRMSVVSITSPDGRVIDRFAVGSGIEALDISALPAGIYLLHVELHDHNELAARFIKL